MKKILFTILVSGALFTSCSMNELPAGQIDDTTAIESVQDAMKFRNGIYNQLRSMTAGGYITYPAIQSDEFIGTQANGNRMGNISTATFNSATNDLEGLWSGPYGMIASVNYFLPKVEALLQNAELSDDALASLHRYKGEAHWARAFAYYTLVKFYCDAYNRIDPQAANTGVPLVTVYEPSGDYASYPGRSSLAETYAQIESDLNTSYSELNTFETSGVSGATDNLAPNASYLSTLAVEAFQARIALLKGDWATAVSKAEGVINSGVFALETGKSYYDMWETDEGDELIFVPYGNQAQSGGVPATGAVWLSNTEGVFDYVVSANLLDLYDPMTDVRYDSFFAPGDVNVNGQYVTCPAFYKFPGNSELNTSTSNSFLNLPKPLRLSETYLILAEAAANNSDEVKANKALNDIRKARIDGYTDQNYTGTNLQTEIRNERAKELIGEGFRISDLRRWGLGFSRSYTYSDLMYEDAASALVPTSMTTSYTPGDYRYVMPIPSNEMDTNPQLAGHQNPGW